MAESCECYEEAVAGSVTVDGEIDLGLGGLNNSHHEEKNPSENYVMLNRASDFAALVKTEVKILVLRARNL
jgi:hypothetical protein